MDPIDAYYGKRLKNMGGMHRAPANSKMRLLQAARHIEDVQEEYQEGKIAVNKRYFESNSTYNLFERAEDCAHIYSFQWGMTNIRLIL